MKRLGKAGPDKAPPANMREVVVGANGPTPRKVMVPEGIDPGFGYNVGEAAFGKRIAEEEMNVWRASKNEAWDVLTPGDWSTEHRSAKISTDTTRTLPGKKIGELASLAAGISTVIGGEEKVIRHEPSSLSVMVNAEVLAQHMDPARAQYLPYLLDVLNDPYEIWATFQQHRGTGSVVLRYRVIKSMKMGRFTSMLLVVEVQRGVLLSYTMVPIKENYLQKQRRGKLIWGRE